MAKKHKIQAHHHESAHHHGTEEASIAEIDASLSAIYGEERDDLQTVAMAPNRLTRFLIRAVVALATICVVSVASFFIYDRFFSSARDGKPLLLTFVVPDDVQSGAETTIELGYVNQTAYPLTNVEIDINLPSGFKETGAMPDMTDAQGYVWNLGTIGAKSDGKIVLKGIWQADVPSATGIQALVGYKPANFNAQFHDIAVKTVSTTTSTTNITIDAPAEANVGESVAYTIHVVNNGLQTLTAPKLVVTLPAGFFVASSTPTIAAGSAPEYTLPDILPTTEQIVTVTGAFASDVSGSQALTAVSGVAGARFSPQASATALTDVKPSALSITMVGNGESGSIAADPGTLLRIALRLENTSDVAITDATALLDFTAEDNIPIDWGAAVLDGGKTTAKGITFDAKAIGSIAAKDNVTLSLAFPLKSDLSAVSSTFSVAFSATRGAITIAATPLTVSLNSDASISSTLRYFDEDGAPLGSGPLPPTVGTATHYRAVWSVTGGLHGLRDVSVSAVLPDSMVWDDFSISSSGTITFDATSRVVRWTISSIPAGSGEVTARMSLSFTPAPSDIGLVKTVLGKSQLAAKDDMSGAAIERSADPITTSCDGDSFATGKGVVKG